MSDRLGSNDTPETATYLGAVMPPGYQSVYPIFSNNFIEIDSANSNSSDIDPVDYFKFSVPEGVTKVRLKIDWTDNANNIAVQYEATILNATVLSGQTVGQEAVGSEAVRFPSPNTTFGVEAEWGVGAGDYIIKVDIRNIDGGFPSQLGYTLSLDVWEWQTTQPNTGGEQPPVNEADIDGTNRSDIIYGTDGDDNIYGFDGNDKIYGLGGDDSLFGMGGNDTLSGGNGDDLLFGGAGKDALRGGSGYDGFVFAEKPSRTNIDKILDFNVKHDYIYLFRSAFPKVGAGETLSKNAYWASSSGKAHDRSDRIIYDRDDGRLYYDPDGTGPAASKQFAQISANLKLKHTDFILV
ncbi:MAG TPA: calcium-binding protein [Microvirga sp.]|nr:calcium-binding protein [Microvirga sp.]